MYIEHKFQNKYTNRREACQCIPPYVLHHDSRINYPDPSAEVSQDLSLALLQEIAVVLIHHLLGAEGGIPARSHRKNGPRSFSHLV